MNIQYILAGIVFFISAYFFNPAIAESLSTMESLIDTHKPMVLTIGQKILVVRLKSNATTGFSWFLKNYDHDLLTLEGHRYIAPVPSKMVGVPGEEEWTFKINSTAYLAPQISQIEWVYARPWATQIPSSTKITWISRVD